LDTIQEKHEKIEFEH